MSLSAEMQRVRNEFAEGVAEFVETECDLGQTFASAAANTEDAERRARNLKNARAAYESAARYLGRIDDKQVPSRSRITGKLNRLRKLIDTLAEDDG
jgi:hypothetical protein